MKIPVLVKAAYMYIKIVPIFWYKLEPLGIYKLKEHK